MNIRFNVRGYIDRRSGDTQRAADALLEAEWQRRVRENPTERARLAREAAERMPGLLKKQALDMRRAPLIQDEEQSP